MIIAAYGTRVSPPHEYTENKARLGPMKPIVPHTRTDENGTAAGPARACRETKRPSVSASCGWFANWLSTTAARHAVRPVASDRPAIAVRLTIKSAIMIGATIR